MTKCANPIVFLLIQFALVNYSQQQYNNQPVSACPHIFEYRFDGNEWYGVIQVKSPRTDQKQVLLHVSLLLRAAITQNNKGSIIVLGTAEETANNIINQRPIKYKVRFPLLFPLPQVVQIVYDNELVCADRINGISTEDFNSGLVSRIELKHILNPSVYLYMHNNNNNAQRYTHNKTPGSNFINNMFPSHHQTANANPDRQPPVSEPSDTPQRTPYPVKTLKTLKTFKTSNRRPTSQNPDAICGQRYATSQVLPLVNGGESTKRGDWPWMVAIYLNKPSGLSFNCGGSLVSSRVVVTAAHCINTETQNYLPHELLLWLGRHSLLNWSEAGSVASNVQQIFIHADYKRQRGSYDADIAVLVMQKQIEFTRFVRPICLWPSERNFADVEDENGTVVGWGTDGSDQVVSNIQKRIDIAIVNSKTCAKTSESLSKAVSNRTFCAGSLNGDGPCHGDSGSGLSIQLQNRWTLLGIVSAGLSDANTGACKLTHYVIFTDVSKFIDWIRGFL